MAIPAPIEDMIYQRGTIAKKATNSYIDWPNATFYAYAAGESFENFSVVTLIAHYQMLAHEQAMNEVEYTGNDQTWAAAIEERANEIMDSGRLLVREMVQVSDDYNVLVVLNEEIVSDASMDRALGMLQESTLPGTTYFGDLVTYTAAECAEHTERHMEV